MIKPSVQQVMSQITTNCTTTRNPKWALLPERSADIFGGKRTSQSVQVKSRRRRQDQTGHRRHKAKTASTRPRRWASILRRKQTTSDWQTWTSEVSATTAHFTEHVPTANIRSATIHQEQPCRLYLDAKRRPTFRVHPLRNGSVDHKRLRYDDTSLPSHPPSFAVWKPKHEETRYGQDTTFFVLDKTSFRIWTYTSARSTSTPTYISKYKFIDYYWYKNCTKLKGQDTEPTFPHWTS